MIPRILARSKHLFRRSEIRPHWVSPKHLEEVEIVPCNGIDLQTRHIVVTYGLVVNARLDPEKLRQSLWEVVGARFRKVGSRLVYRNSTYECHIPRSFSESVPPVSFTTDNYDEVYGSPARPRIPTALAGYTRPVIEAVPAFECYLRSKNCPVTIDGFLVQNTPAVHVHITTFFDVTFIGITSSHLMFDAMGTKTLLEAWSRRLNGTSMGDITGMECDSRPVETLQTSSAVGRRGWFDLPLFGKIRFVIALLWRQLLDPKEVSLLVCVPKHFLSEMKTDVIKELKTRNLGEWVGSSDILLAWWYKTIYGNRTDTTPISIHVPVNLRRIFSETAFSRPYLHNAVMTLPIPPLPARSFGTLSLTDLSLHFRSAISKYVSDIKGIQSDVSFRLANPEKVLFPCPAHGEFVILTNWRSAKYGELDFSGAADGDHARVIFMVGYPKYTKAAPMRGSGMIIHEDEEAIWMIQVRGGREWRSLRERTGSQLLFLESGL
ncbi:hypothetical protein C8R47DRAFT_1052356 [Mycena vitilis]|nr:hypothetical protein C8R47DRAFT_1052356 [Mycena vitilis]